MKFMNPARALKERADQVKEILGPKRTLYLIDDPDKGQVWVEKVDAQVKVLAKGLATFTSQDKEFGFLSVRIGRNNETREVVHLYRDHGTAITSMRKNVTESYKPFEEMWYTATMIPIALMYGENWKRLG